MKSKITIYMVIGLALLNSACKKALDLKQQGVYTSDNYFRNEVDAVNAVSGIYSLLEEEDYVGHAEATFDVPSDDYWRSGDHSEDEGIENLTYDASNAAIRYPWKWRYETINRATNCIINIPKITAISTDIKNRSMGEAYFLRAFGYWRLMIIHGDVPIITEDDYSKQTFNVPKSPIEEVRKQIESDLLKAVDLLPESYGSADRGRVSKGTALGLLTKLYMYWEKLPEAITTGQKVISNSHYALAANYADNFTRANETSTELLFSIQAVQTVVQNDFTVYYIPRSWNGYGFSQPLQGLANEFEAGDPRKQATLLSVGDKVDLGDGKGLTTFTADLSATGYAFKKYAVFNTEADGGGVDHSYAVPLMRSADIYLLVAEALIRTQGAGAGDALINQIRHRASASLKPVSGAGMKELIHERRVELAGEDQRHQDLMRWDKKNIVDIAAIYNLAVSKAPLDQNKTVTFVRPKNYYFPIPQVEIDKSKGVLVQNPNFK
ncbi:RagB/SusD family nutrient uptake outer membrane protein [Mucilaginibacter rubeus]|uniref:RagB/SusD family nutrient uptake outer membrane protein n=1 Tax=Mucilaginibacter rubeus TaxID=2027860 RepID=A0AAE6JG16_9SPHI|nr:MULTISPECIES: RagB/SusD family nutrient uptake outer membrane protein [Mucilaginibacter]QEM05064.1 RagB/SusD family nutrient uptake outer membrane protein [Mucilaginibacter rubeus]QEM17657.1 RagB/SusD family nutrient uptake outer membrane protein [Mucilaginibacter gossypii]QTE45819.1 RagB/SusD family nutrient uptake outer membrane protein [Mucilaginibacter rubeus]QTE52416.1 RagB/SusD family nutrient uptake outer membrane protein [Mucilaginibacter rubeus]QTE57504.1 RagB/SusD family nutrient 